MHSLDMEHNHVKWRDPHVKSRVSAFLAADDRRQLDHEAMLARNPRVVRVGPNAAKIATQVQHLLAI